MTRLLNYRDKNRLFISREMLVAHNRPKIAVFFDSEGPGEKCQHDFPRLLKGFRLSVFECKYILREEKKKIVYY